MINYNRACQPCQQESPLRLHLINTAYMDRTTNTLSQLTGYRHSWTLSRTSFIFSNASCADTLAERPWLKCDSFWGDSQRWFCIWRHYMKCFWDSVPLMYANVAQQIIIQLIVLLYFLVILLPGWLQWIYTHFTVIVFYFLCFWTRLLVFPHHNWQEDSNLLLSKQHFHS